MKAILFCANPYAFGILKPLNDELLAQNHDVLWYIPAKISEGFPFEGQVKQTGSISDLCDYGSDVIFVPGNEVPHYLRGIKAQVFHGLAGEKSGHFRIRNYFDLYLTQGPYFTTRFEDFARKHGDFEVKETGWCKLDPLFQHHKVYREERDRILSQSGKKQLILYAPTFSPSLTSAPAALQPIFDLADQEDIFLMIKFHDLMDISVIDHYRVMASSRKNVTIVEDRNILKYLIMADLMISDTSSVVYEFILLNKPVITINSTSDTINWRNFRNPNELVRVYRNETGHDTFLEKRLATISRYHPYTDGRSSARMISAVEDYIQRNGVPEKRKINLWRRLKMNRMFGPKPGK